MRKLTFRHVETIHAIMLTGTVTGAAQRMHLTQPAVSNMLRDAEECLDFPLFERLGGRLVPTSHAELLFEEIECSFTGLNEINGLCQRIQQSKRRKLTISATPGFSATVLPQILRAYGEGENVPFFSVLSRSTQHVTAMVSSRKADLGFALKSPPIPGVCTEVLAELPVWCYLPPGHLLAQQSKVRASDLRDMPMITLSTTEGIDDLVANAFRGCGGHPPSVAECPAVITACAMVEAGLGFTVLDPLMAYHYRHSAMRALPFEPSVKLVFQAYWHESRSADKDRVHMVMLAKRWIEELMAPFMLDADAADCCPPAAPPE